MYPAPGVRQLLRQSIVSYGGRPWTGKHLTWLRSHRFDDAGLQVAYDSAVEAMLLTADRRDRLDASITAMAAESEFTAVVDPLGCLRGVSTLPSPSQMSGRCTGMVAARGTNPRFNYG